MEEQEEHEHLIDLIHTRSRSWPRNENNDVVSPSSSRTDCLGETSTRASGSLDPAYNYFSIWRWPLEMRRCAVPCVRSEPASLVGPSHSGRR